MTSNGGRGGSLAARVRAARAYADYKRGDLGRVLHVSEETVSRIEAGTREPSDRELEQIASACGVPLAFMEVGFAPMERPVSDLERRVLLIEEQMAGLLAQADEDTEHDLDRLTSEIEDAPEPGEQPLGAAGEEGGDPS